MLATAENPRAVIGGNHPPEPTRFEAAEKAINDLYAEASLWLDGAAVTSQEQADGLSNLLNMLRDARKKADEARKVEKRPHDDAAKAVDAKYKPLLGCADLAADGCKKALGPWLVKLDEEKRAVAEKARQEAEGKTRLAQEAIRASDATNLAARAAAEAMLKDAKKAEKSAKRAEKDTASAGGDVGRAAALRTTYRAEFTDPVLAVRHYWLKAHDEMCGFLLTLAEKDIRAGARTIPGIEVIEEKTVV